MSFFGNLKRDAVGTLSGLNPVNIISAISHPDRTIANMLDFYGQLGRHPIRSFENAPISSALGIAPMVGPLAKLARLKAAGVLSPDIAGLDASVLKSPADAAFADVSVAPPTSWSLPSENGFGVAMSGVPTSNIFDAIRRGPGIHSDTFQSSIFDSPVMDTRNPLHPNDVPINTAEDVFDVANTADYINPDSPNLGLLMNNHLRATQDSGIPADALGDVPEASGLDYASMGPQDFANMGMSTPLPPELQSFLSPNPYRPRLQDTGPMNLSMNAATGLTGAAGGNVPQLLRSMMADAQPSVQQRLLNMLMQQFSQH